MEQNNVPDIALQLKLHDTFNEDEFGLFYQCLPIKYSACQEKMIFWGVKKSKVTLTSMAAASYQNPLKGINQVSIRYQIH